MRTIFLASLLAACGPCAAQQGPTPAPPSTRPSASRDSGVLRIGTWNLEHFGSRKPPRTDADLAKIAAFIKGMQVDVLAVQEINDAESLDKLVRRIGPEWRFVLGTSGTFGEGKNAIRVGFLWNTERVEALQCEEMLHMPRQIGDLYVFHRKPVNVVFRSRTTGFDFRAITVHLKASKGKKNEAKRSAEAGLLRDYVQRLGKSTTEDQDIVILGDFNHTYDAPAHKVLGKDDLVHYVKGEGLPSIVWFDEPIDQIGLTKGLRPEAREKTFRVHNQTKNKEEAEKAWRSTYSDHFPVTIDLDASEDADPQATFAKVGHPLPIRGGNATSRPTSRPR